MTVIRREPARPAPARIRLGKLGSLVRFCTATMAATRAGNHKRCGVAGVHTRPDDEFAAMNAEEALTPRAFAAQALGPYCGPGRGFAGQIGRSFHRAKVRAVTEYVEDFVAMQGWPPVGPHLVRFCWDGRDRQFAVTFPAYRCQLSPGWGQALTLRASRVGREAQESRQWAFARLDRLAPFLAACVREKASRTARRQVRESVGSWLEGLAAMVFLFAIVFSVAAILGLEIWKALGTVCAAG